MQREKRAEEDEIFSIANSMDMNLSKLLNLRETVEDRGAQHAVVHGVAESEMTKRLNNNKDNQNEAL